MNKENLKDNVEFLKSLITDIEVLNDSVNFDGILKNTSLFIIKFAHNGQICEFNEWIKKNDDYDNFYYLEQVDRAYLCNNIYDEALDVIQGKMDDVEFFDACEAIFDEWQKTHSHEIFL